MRKTIHDRCAGASSGRRSYLEDRLDRVLGEHNEKISAVELELRPETDPEDDAEVVAATIAIELADGETARVSARHRALPTALAQVFDAAGHRLAAGSGKIGRLGPGKTLRVS
jgi:hypothetical protein